ncbi:MAG: galactose-1-phosphate uridylyltransferase [Pirellulales bacterium]
MSEIRRDPLLKFEIVIAEGRSERPDQWHQEAAPPSEMVCPFCEGNEQTTPHESCVSRESSSLPDQPGWQVRVVPNRYPSLNLDYQSYTEEDSDFFTTLPANGVQDVVIESPQHLGSFTQLPEENARLTMLACRDRLREIQQDGRFKHCQIFKNVGPAAGASLEHSHSQIMASDRVPAQVTAVMEASALYFEQNGISYWADLIKRELSLESRVVQADDDFVVLCPFASRFPLQTLILPRVQQASFGDANSALLAKLAKLTQRMLLRIEKLLKVSSYNYLIHTTPFDTIAEEHYHWQLEILPRITTPAGYEWGTGVFVNPMAPERAAQLLRAAN